MIFTSTFNIDLSEGTLCLYQIDIRYILNRCHGFTLFILAHLIWYRIVNFALWTIEVTFWHFALWFGIAAMFFSLINSVII